MSLLGLIGLIGILWVSVQQVFWVYWVYQYNWSLHFLFFTLDFSDKLRKKECMKGRVRLHLCQILSPVT